MSEVVAASRPMPSAQSGITAWREARTAATSSAPMPTVRKIFAWLAPTERKVAGAGGADVAVGVAGRCMRRQVGNSHRDQRRDGERADAGPVRAADPHGMDQRGGEERAEEQADPHHAAEGRERAGAEVERDRPR